MSISILEGTLMKPVIKLILSALVFFTPALTAEDRLQLDETSIQGASELPKVLYIVPWKKAEIGDKPVKVNRLVDEVMSPVDKDVLKRQIRYHEQITAE